MSLDWSRWPNFSKSEFACPCCGEADMDSDFMDALQAFRTEARRVVNITSGYRCKYKNDRVGGAKNSSHLTGQGADFVRPKAMNGKRLIGLMHKHFNGVGLRLHGDNQYCHGDTKPRDGGWTYE